MNCGDIVAQVCKKSNVHIQYNVHLLIGFESEKKKFLFVFPLELKHKTSIAEGSTVSDVVTYGGYGKEPNCIFPFNFNNKTYSECISSPCSPWDEACDGSQTWCARWAVNNIEFHVIFWI